MKVKALLRQKLSIVENLQQADKLYFNTGKLPPDVRTLILNITHGDVFTKFITDIYALRGDTIKPQELRNIHQELKTYNKNVFPIEGFNINGGHVGKIVLGLNKRSEIIKNLKQLPSIAIRNLKNDIRQVRTPDELSRYHSDLEYFLMYYSMLSNRPEQLRKKISDKIFKSGTSLRDMLTFIEDKQSLLGGEKFTKNKVKALLNNYHGDLGVIYDKGNIMIVEVSGPEGIKDIGCNSLWCFTYGSSFDAAYRTWNNYSTNDIVYVIIDFAQPTDSPDFMYVLIKPLKDEYDDDGNDSPLFDMSNEQVYEPLRTIDRLIGLNNAKKLLTFGEEPKPEEPEKERPFVDPNQLSLWESLRKKLGYSLK